MAVEDAYAQASREVGLTSQQAQLLCAAQRPSAVGDLAAFLRCDRSNVSHLVERIAGQGLIERRSSVSDRRVKLVALSGPGEELVRRFVALLGARFDAILDGWPEVRRAEATAVLNDLADAFDVATSVDEAAREPSVTATRFP